MNFKSLGISLTGNFENDKLEGKQLTALIKLLQEKVEQYNIPRNRISYHKNFKATACPGRNVINLFEFILDQVYGRDDGLVTWELNALEFVAKKGIITEPAKAPFTLKQVAWIAEVIRKVIELTRKN
jgi:hypothetical protein